ncbi:DUF1963 domain-containing protein [Thioclava sp. BHET1]|nr:DUF1963 domain-containing protein [Thioclava sp. BHET1]
MSPGTGELEQKSLAEDEERARKLEAVRTELMSLASEFDRTQRAFLEAVQEFRQEPFDQNKVAIFIEQLLPLPLPDFNLKRDRDGVIVGIELVATSLCELDQSHWSNPAGRYRNSLDNYLFEQFVCERHRLPPPQRNRIEKICEFRAQYESGGMSHAPHGFIYTAYGQKSKNEVLLELPSSLLVGWMWADSASMVILINREDLKNGRFDKVITDVTN